MTKWLASRNLVLRSELHPVTFYAIDICDRCGSHPTHKAIDMALNKAYEKGIEDAKIIGGHDETR